MTSEACYEVVGLIDNFYNMKRQREIMFLHEMLKIQLTKYITLDDIPQLRGCYLTTKVDPSIMTDPDATSRADKM